MTYNEAVEYIINVPRFNKYKDWDYSANATLLALMEELGNPHLKVKSIHVAGTNGKGSTVQLIKNILVESGYKVGCFVSPHLIRINERISVWDKLSLNLDDTYISDHDFLCAFELVEEKCGHLAEQGLPSLTFFEYMFAIAAVYFSSRDIDYCIYETGLGGRLDATNILMPEVTVITSIGLDHMKLLGDTIEKIAGEKAGIIKEGIPVVYNTGEQVADEVISRYAKKLSAPEINVAKAQYIINDFNLEGIDFSCSNSYYRYQNIYISSTGIYQVNNALTAIEACSVLKEFNTPISEEIIKKACGQFFWQGRMEQLSDCLVIDGAHNLDAIIQFVNSVQARCKFEEINILFAVADDKNYEDMIKYLCANLRLKNIYVTALRSDRKVLAQEVAEIFEKFIEEELGIIASAIDIVSSNDIYDGNASVHIYYHNDISTVFSKAFVKAKEDGDLLFCVGSLYLIGEIKELYIKQHSMEEHKDD